VNASLLATGGILTGVSAGSSEVLHAEITRPETNIPEKLALFSHPLVKFCIKYLQYSAILIYDIEIIKNIFGHLGLIRSGAQPYYRHAQTSLRIINNQKIFEHLRDLHQEFEWDISRP
jgi:hypothetical protein